MNSHLAYASEKIRVLIVDDSALARKTCHDILSSDNAFEVVGHACDAFDARNKIKALNPQVLTLDIQMPGMDGLDFLEKLMQLRPMPVVMVSSLTEEGSTETLKALELGAVDYTPKPSLSFSLEAFSQQLRCKVKIAATAKIKPLLKNPQPIHRLEQNCKPDTSKIIGIGSSTGGVEALTLILTQLPKETPPILVCQHMPPRFTTSFAARLNQRAAIGVVEAQDQMVVLPNHAYIAPGGYHMCVEKRLKNFVICLKDNNHMGLNNCPSVDVLFHSLADVAASHTAAFILTGMGSDGALGLKALYDKGAMTFAQNEASCVVYGMPRMAKEMGAVMEEVHLNHIAHKIMNLSGSKGDK
jgi:two-component system chemotaxis response regulator CheB